MIAGLLLGCIGFWLIVFGRRICKDGDQLEKMGWFDWAFGSWIWTACAFVWLLMIKLEYV